MLRRGPMLRLLLAGCTCLVVACGGGGGGDATGPSSSDQDSDGILDANDKCPSQPETVNQWKDEDGCPDSTDELYQAARSDVEQYWTRKFASNGRTYSPITTFEGYTTEIQTPCGPAHLNNAFFCPVDRGIYYDKPFLDQFLEIGPYSAYYIVAHELGHSVQNQLGYTHENNPTILLELQADCFAGAYTQDAKARHTVEEGDIEDAVVSLFRVGDPLGTPWFDPQAHGSPGQRIDAFNLGVQKGVPACTSSAPPPPPPPGAASTTTDILSDSPDPSAPGQAVTVTVSVTSTGGTPTGLVQVSTLGGTESCSGVLTNGSATCTLTLTNEGTRTIIGSYAGSTSFGPSSDTEEHVVQVPQPTTGQLQITTSTSGSDQDPDGYTYSVDGGQAQQIGLNSSATLSNVAEGSHTVMLSGVASNCSVDNASKTASVSAGATAVVSFAINCTARPATTGSIQVTTATTGPDQDPDGYSFSIDHGTSQSIGLNDAKVIANVPSGDHTIALSGLAANCSVDSPSRPATVFTGTTVTVPFTITCSANPPAVGSIRVSTITTGESPDPDGYQFAIDGGSSLPIGVSAGQTVSGVPVGAHTVVLSNVAPNCSVENGETHNVSVTEAQTAEVAYNIDCTSTDPDASRSSVTAEPAAIETGASSTITVTVRNGSGAVMAGVPVSLSATGTGNTISPTSATTDASGNAVFTFSSTVAEKKTITATAGGVTLKDVDVNVTARSSTTSITEVSPETSVAGENVHVTVSVIGEGGGTPTGTVTVSTDRETTECNAVLSDGTATCDLPLTTVGTHTIAATYLGDEQFDGSADPDGAQHEVTAAATAMTASQDR